MRKMQMSEFSDILKYKQTLTTGTLVQYIIDKLK